MGRRETNGKLEDGGAVYTTDDLCSENGEKSSPPARWIKREQAAGGVVLVRVLAVVLGWGSAGGFWEAASGCLGVVLVYNDLAHQKT